MASQGEMRDGLIEAMPRLQAFAVSLCGNSERASDLVQETMVKAWAKHDSFAQGTNLSAWLFTILRNAFYSEFRKRRREVRDATGQLTDRLASMPEQYGHMDMQDFRHALTSLPAGQRDLLIMIGAMGLSYQEVADRAGCAVGTVKSRVNRARNRLAAALRLDSAAEFGPDGIVQATLATRPN